MPFGSLFPYFFVYFFTANQIFSFDAVTNAIACESNEPIRWFHSNHPLYPFLGVVWYRLEAFLGYTGSSLYSLARFNSLLVSLGLGILFLPLRRISGGLGGAATVLVLGFSYAFWHFAVDGRAVGISVFFAALIVVSLFSLNEKKTWNSKQMIGLGILSTLYTLSHGIGLFHVGGITYWIWNSGNQEKRRHLTLYLATFGLLLMATHFSLYLSLLSPTGQGSFTDWLLGYGAFGGSAQIWESQFWIFKIKEIGKGLWLGWTHAFYKPLNSAPFKENLFSMGIGLLMLGTFVFGLFKVKTLKNTEKPLVWALTLWGFLVMIFLAFWSPGQEGFRLHVLVPWGVATALVFKKTPLFHKGAGLMAIVLFSLNLSGPIYHASFIKNNEGFQLLKELKDTLEPGDIFLSGQSGIIPQFEVLGPYFFPELKGGTIEGRLFALRENSLQPLKKRLEIIQRNGHSIFLAEDMYDLRVQEQIEKNRSLRWREIDTFLDDFEIQSKHKLSNGRKFLKVYLKHR